MNKTMNLEMLMQGRDLTPYQKSLALQEYTQLRKEVERLREALDRIMINSDQDLNYYISSEALYPTPVREQALKEFEALNQSQQ